MDVSWRVRVGVVWVLAWVAACGSDGPGAMQSDGGMTDAAADGGDAGDAGADGGSEVRQKVGVEGGEIEGPGGMRIEVPANALKKDVEIRVALATEKRIDGDYERIGEVFVLGPDGQSFERPVTLRLPYAVEDLPVREDERRLVALHGSDDGESWEEVDSRAYDGVLTARIEHFSRVGIGLRRRGACKVVIRAQSPDNGARYEEDFDAHGYRERMRELRPDGSSHEITIQRNGRGLVTESTTEDDSDGDGATDVVWTETRTYDVDADSYVSVNERDDLGDGTVEERHTDAVDGIWWTRMSVLELDDDADGEANSRSTRSYEYDEEGRVTTRLTEVDSDADGTPDSREQLQSDYEGTALASFAFTRDADLDGTLEIEDRSMRTFDMLGREATYEQTFEGGDVGNPYRLSEVTTYADGEMTVMQETDWDLDGVVDASSTTVSTLDGEGRVVMEVVQRDIQPADGMVDVIAVVTQQFDSRGNRTLSRTEWDNDADGEVDAVDETTASFDADGNPTAESVTQDWDADGTADYERTSTYELDGRALATRVEQLLTQSGATTTTVSTATYEGTCGWLGAAFHVGARFNLFE